MKLPGVIGVGIGQFGGQPVIEVLVTQRTSDSISQSIPNSIEGHPVVIVEAGEVEAQIKERGSDGT